MEDAQARTMCGRSREFLEGYAQAFADIGRARDFDGVTRAHAARQAEKYRAEIEVFFSRGTLVHRDDICDSEPTVEAFIASMADELPPDLAR